MNDLPSRASFRVEAGRRDYYAPQGLTAEDTSQLNHLALAHYILGGLGMAVSLFPLVHVALGIGVISGAVDAPPVVGALFLTLGLSFVILGETVSVCMIVSGNHLKQRTGYTFSFVMACIACISFPIGTAVGVLTLIVLSRPAVKAAFDTK